MKHGDLIYSKSLNIYAFFIKDLQGTSSIEVKEIGANTHSYFLKSLFEVSKVPDFKVGDIITEVPKLKTHRDRDDSGIYIVERVIDDKTILLSIKEHPTISRFVYDGTVRLFSVRKDFFRLVNSGNFRRIKYE